MKILSDLSLDKPSHCSHQATNILQFTYGKENDCQKSSGISLACLLRFKHAILGEAF